MADLSKIDVRQTYEGRLTRNNDGVLPTRRNTEAPRLEVNASMRDAARGDGGAAELLRILGGASKAAAGVQDTMMDRQVIKDRESAKADKDQATQDSLNGTVDQQKMKVSLAYRKWRTEGLVSEQLINVDTAIKDDVMAMVNSGEEYRGSGSDPARPICLRRTTHRGALLQCENTPGP